MRIAPKLVAAGMVIFAGVNFDMTNPSHPISQAHAQALRCVFNSVANGEVVIRNDCGFDIYWRACVTYPTGMREDFDGPGIVSGDQAAYTPPSANGSVNFNAYVLSSPNSGQYLHCP
jgi:hypothetical protein